MKGLFTAFFIAIAIFVSGCADPLEKPITQEAGEKFQRGISGHGTLGPMNDSSNSLKPDIPNSGSSEP